jgi:hypothetical protein
MTTGCSRLPRKWPGYTGFCLFAGMTWLSYVGCATEYEVDGLIGQEIKVRGDRVVRTSASFTVFVRDCGWLIRTVETNEIGSVTEREVGSTNETEIYECYHVIRGNEEGTTRDPSAAAARGRRRPIMLANIFPGGVPVGQLDTSVVGHLWLMFASHCYWPALKTNQITPVYEWRASPAAHGQNLTVSGGWELFSGNGSLPRRVWYTGEYGETNASYTAVNPRSVGANLVPGGFSFQRFEIGPLNQDTYTHELVAVKTMDATVTELRGKCSRPDLIPFPSASAVIIDWRFDGEAPGRPASYRSPIDGRWPTLGESKELARKQAESERNRVQGQAVDERPSSPSSRHRAVVLALMFVALLVPIVLFVSRCMRRGLR